jgi:hypothetical protein
MLEDLEKCDLQGSDNNHCVLVINDYGVTENEQERLVLMRRKLARYSSAISDGLIGDHEIPRSNYSIEINCSYDPKGLYDEFNRLDILDEQARKIRIPINTVIRLKPPVYGN